MFGSECGFWEDDPMSQLGLTLSRHLRREQRKHPFATGELTGILDQVGAAAKIVNAEVNKAGLVDILGITGGKNPTGDETQKLDVYANELFKEALGFSGHFCVMASEEEEDVVVPPEPVPPGKYAIAFDPLDGSSNIDVNVSIGTIFCVFRRITPRGSGTDEDLLQPGRRLVAAGYIIYGSSTMMVYTTGEAVHGFTLDPSVGMFLLSNQDMRIPSRGRIYSVNEAYANRWDPPVRRFVEGLRASGEYKSRYIGSMVSDVHRTLLTGGIFMYPGETKAPNGKLRLLYEAAPMAFVIECAGGASSNGHRSLLELEPKDLHERTPVFLGSAQEVRALEAAIAEGGEAE